MAVDPEGLYRPCRACGGYGAVFNPSVYQQWRKEPDPRRIETVMSRNVVVAIPATSNIGVGPVVRCSRCLGTRLDVGAEEIREMLLTFFEELPGRGREDVSRLHIVGAFQRALDDEKFVLFEDHVRMGVNRYLLLCDEARAALRKG